MTEQREEATRKPAFLECLGTIFCLTVPLVWSYWLKIIWVFPHCKSSSTERYSQTVYFFSVPDRSFFRYKVHHAVAWNSLTLSSHLLLSQFFLTRGKELLKHQQESFSHCGTVLLNLCFLPQHPTISWSSTAATAVRESRLARDLVAILWGFQPSSPLTSFLTVLSSHNTKHEYSFISFW